MASGLSVELTTEGYDVTARRFREMAERHEPAEMMITNGLVIKAMEEYHKDTWGKNVKDQSQTLVRWPQQKGPLWLTGKLRDSMIDSRADGAVRLVTPSRVLYGTSIFYGRFVNDGTSRMPPKPFLKFNTPLKVLIRDVYVKRIMSLGEDLAGFPSPGRATEE